MAGVPAGNPHSTAIPERSPCPTNAACGGCRAGAAATCSPAAGGGSSLQEGAIRKSKEKPGWRSRCGRTFPAGKLLGSAPLGSPCSWRSRQRGTAWCCVEEHRAGASPTHHAPTGISRRCSRLRLCCCLRQISLSIPSPPPRPARSPPPRQHRPPQPGTVGPGSASQGQPDRSGSHRGHRVQG